jgi:hypothetical protein
MASKSNALLLAALASGKSERAAAALAGISERTAQRRMAKPEFRRELAKAREAMLDRSIGHLAAGGTEAAVVLRNLLRSDDGKLRLGAARAVLAAGCQLREVETLAAKVAELEQIVKGRQGDRRHGFARQN